MHVLYICICYHFKIYTKHTYLPWILCSTLKRIEEQQKTDDSIITRLLNFPLANTTVNELMERHDNDGSRKKAKVVLKISNILLAKCYILY